MTQLIRSNVVTGQLESACTGDATYQAQEREQRLNAGLSTVVEALAFGAVGVEVHRSFKGKKILITGSSGGVAETRIR